MTVEKKTLGFLLFRGPDSEDVRTVTGLAEAALERGIGVEIFVMHQAVLNSTVEVFAALAGKGATVTVCSHNADELKAYRIDDFKYGSQYDHSNMLTDVDRYVAFI